MYGKMLYVLLFFIILEKVLELWIQILLDTCTNVW